MTNLCICTQNAGEISQFFSKTRGVNQGCPISPFCYNLISAIMSHLITAHPHVQGVKLNKIHTPQIITQFADNTGLYLRYSHECLEFTIQVLTCIENNTGLKISYDKTCIYRVGSLKNTNAKLYTSKEFTWSDDDIDMLGVHICNNAMQSTSQYDAIIEKMIVVINTWNKRSIPLISKVLIVNTLMGSLFVHTMMVLPPLTGTQIQ